uniref:BHLH domain-containing protein n=1 Tax=Scylla olivacea TaxID=85551 RepID=A0A0P4W2H7_SCYOL
MRSSAAMPRRKKPQASAVVVLRKYRRLRRRRRRSLRHEYHKLRSLLPGAPRSPQLRRKVGVVDAAYHYICQLQSALLAKFSARGVPADLAGVVGGKVSSASDVRALAIHLIHSTNMTPSFMTPSASRGLSPFRHTSSASSQSTSSLSSRISTTQYLARKSNFKK